MGDDGHTASLFPHNPKLPEALDMNNDTLCIAMTPSTAPHERMSLTLAALLQAHRLYLHFEGEKKRLVFDEAIKNTDANEMPIRALLHQDTKDIEVYYA
jgi:6-phosphogluconolactonase